MDIGGEAGTPLGVLGGLSSDQLCPNLESIAWSNVPNLGDRDALKDMVWARWRAPSRKLRKVTVLLNSRLVGGRDWYKLRQEGLEVELITASNGFKAKREWREYFPVV